MGSGKKGTAEKSLKANFFPPISLKKLDIDMVKLAIEILQTFNVIILKIGSYFNLQKMKKKNKLGLRWSKLSKQGRIIYN